MLEFTFLPKSANEDCFACALVTFGNGRVEVFVNTPFCKHQKELFCQMSTFSSTRYKYGQGIAQKPVLVVANFWLCDSQIWMPQKFQYIIIKVYNMLYFKCVVLMKTSK